MKDYKLISVSIPTYLYNQLDEFIEPRKRSEVITNVLENFIITKRLQNIGITYPLANSNKTAEPITNKAKLKKEKIDPIDAFFALNDGSMSMTKEEIVDMIRKDRDEH